MNIQTTAPCQPVGRTGRLWGAAIALPLSLRVTLFERREGRGTVGRPWDIAAGPNREIRAVPEQHMPSLPGRVQLGVGIAPAGGLRGAAKERGETRSAPCEAPTAGTRGGDAAAPGAFGGNTHVGSPLTSFLVTRVTAVSHGLGKSVSRERERKRNWREGEPFRFRAPVGPVALAPLALCAAGRRQWNFSRPCMRFGGRSAEGAVGVCQGHMRREHDLQRGDKPGRYDDADEHPQKLHRPGVLENARAEHVAHVGGRAEARPP